MGVSVQDIVFVERNKTLVIALTLNVNDLRGSMSVAMNLIRPSNQLGDYLFPSDMERFNLDNFNNKSLGWSNQAVSKEQKLQNDLDVISRNTMAFHYLGDDLKYRPSSTHPALNEEVMNENYAKALHPASRRSGNNAASNKNLHKPGKKVRNSKKSTLFNGNTSHEEEKIKIPDNFSSEQEHQNQMNMIFNNPEYFNQVAHQLQENHQEQQQHTYPSMYIIPLEMESQIIPEPSIESHQYPHHVDNNTPVTILSDSSHSVELKSLIDIDNSSDYYSDSASSSLSSSSSSSPCMSSASSSCGGDLDDDESIDMSSSFEVEYHFNKLISNDNEG